MIMKKIMSLLFVIVAWLAIPNSSFAQSVNYTVNLPIPAFEYAGSNNGGLLLNWVLPISIGDDYPGQTAKEALLWSIQDSPIYLRNFSVSSWDDNYLYGYAYLEFGAEDPFSITITGLHPFSQGQSSPTTIVLSNR